MRNRTTFNLIFSLLVLGLLFGVAQPAAARLKVVAPFYIWDDQDHDYKNSMVSLYLDGNETHVIHSVDFDNDLYNPTLASSPNKPICDAIAAMADPNHPQHSKWRANCPGPRSTKFAGILQLSIPREKIEPTGTAKLFTHSLDWSLVDCDLNKDGSWNTSGGAASDLKFNTLLFPPMSPNPPATNPNPILLKNWDIRTVPAPTPTVPIPAPFSSQADFFKILAIDVVTPCSTGNCKDTLVTTLFMDLDIDKDNNLTVAGDGVPVNRSGSLPGGRVCFFARIFPIAWPTTPPSPRWSGNPQARIAAGGGDKTVNLSLFGPTAISLQNLTAESPGGVHPAAWVAAAALLAGASFALLRRSRHTQPTQTRE